MHFPMIMSRVRYLVKHSKAKRVNRFKCAVLYGCRDGHQNIDSLEHELVDGLADLVRYD